MTQPTEACLRATFRAIADGEHNNPSRFGTTLQSAVRLNLTTKAALATLMGVSEAHVFTKGNNMKAGEIRSLCRNLAL
ncbi:MAG: hypothetical protein HYS17_05985 [Micavibrio aeruginosavorus]|uniref:Uncharacterized protein n=1 Tax=Micavibrio aeruginosavorus TaxID=349221 RepID=A0A7T5UJ28_9BACT|nr:MAG: hypothetical protein HYS17_05985 [Micavibrio aeruginosavorus]